MKKIFPLFVFMMFGLILVACGSSAPETVEITLNEFSIQSSLTEFEAGQTYVFNITNSGALNHEFTIMPPDAPAMEGHDMGEMGHNMEGALLHVGEEHLTPGASVTVEYTFDQAADMGPVEFACHLPGHYEAGMRAPIAVNS